MTIKRRAWPLADLMRSYSVWIDAQKVGEIRRRQRRNWEVEPGHHTLQLKIDWCESPALEFDLAAEAEALFVCKAQGTTTTLYSLRRPGEYIRLERVESLS
ncbi:MAG: hypothetical protein QOD60_522 [Solirubrobacterales bacterium]|nr:hypothetical protein [Solirubrobacterales bacterium]